MNTSKALLAVVTTMLVASACAGVADTTTTAERGDTTTTTQATVITTEVTTTTTEVTTTAQSQTATTVADGAATITIANFNFSGPRSVALGTSVMVTNEDQFRHTWTSEDGLWNSGALSQGESFDFTFDEPGEYPYFCTIHPNQMRGTITVEG